MDLTTTRTIDITKLALDGLMERQKAITANTANVMTPNYQRKVVDFESQLKEITKQEDLKTTIKERNSIQYNPSSLDTISSSAENELTPQQVSFLKKDLYNKYEPQIMDDTFSGSSEDGNNVNLEQEVMDMAQVAMRYNVLSTLEQKDFRIIAGAIKGDLSG